MAAHQARALAELVKERREHACPEFAHDRSQHIIAGGARDADVKVLVRAAAVLAAGDDRLHLLQRLRNLGEILRSGALRGFRGYLAFNEDARVEQLDGAGAGVDRGALRWRSRRRT